MLLALYRKRGVGQLEASQVGVGSPYCNLLIYNRTTALK